MATGDPGGGQPPGNDEDEAAYFHPSEKLVGPIASLIKKMRNSDDAETNAEKQASQSQKDKSVTSTLGRDATTKHANIDSGTPMQADPTGQKWKSVNVQQGNINEGSRQTDKDTQQHLARDAGIMTTDERSNATQQQIPRSNPGESSKPQLEIHAVQPQGHHSAAHYTHDRSCDAKATFDVQQTEQSTTLSLSVSYSMPQLSSRPVRTDTPNRLSATSTVCDKSGAEEMASSMDVSQMARFVPNQQGTQKDGEDRQAATSRITGSITFPQPQYVAAVQQGSQPVANRKVNKHRCVTDYSSAADANQISPPEHRALPYSEAQYCSTQQKEIEPVVVVAPSYPGGEQQTPSAITMPTPRSDPRPVCQGADGNTGNKLQQQSSLHVNHATSLLATTTPKSTWNTVEEKGSHAVVTSNNPLKQVMPSGATVGNATATGTSFSTGNDTARQVPTVPDQEQLTATNSTTSTKPLGHTSVSSSPASPPFAGSARKQHHVEDGPRPFKADSTIAATNVMLDSAATQSPDDAMHDHSYHCDSAQQVPATQKPEPAKSGTLIVQPEQNSTTVMMMSPTNTVDHPVAPSASNVHAAKFQSFNATSSAIPEQLSTTTGMTTSGVANQSSFASSTRSAKSSVQPRQKSAITGITQSPTWLPPTGSDVIHQQHGKKAVPISQPRQQSTIVSTAAAASSSLSSMKTTPSSSPSTALCQRCEEESAQCRCPDCELDLCDTCWKPQHRVKKWASHQKCQLSASNTDQPSSTVGRVKLQHDGYVEENYSSGVFNVVTRGPSSGMIGTEPFQVFHLMKLRYDPQEQGDLVRKTLVDKKNLRQLSSFLGLHGSKAASWPIDTHFQNRELATIGLYGNKDRMALWLQQHISLGPADVKVITDESNPGLYCLNNGGNVQYLVFNAPEDAFATMSRKNVSCLLLRCLVELCRPLLVFYDKDELSSFRVLPNFGCKEQERVKAVIVKHVVGVKEDIRLNHGFSVNVSELDISDACLCRSYTHGYFYVSQSVSNEKWVGNTKPQTLYGHQAKEPLKGIMQKLKLLSVDDTDKLHFSQDDILKAENSESEQLTSCVEDTAALYMMEYCPLSCYMLSDIQRLKSEKQRLEESKRTVMENILSISKAEVGHSTSTLDDALEQSAAPLRKMDMAFALYVGITQTNGIANTDVPAMSKFLVDASLKQNKDDLMDHARHLAHTWHNGDLSEEQLGQFVKAGIQIVIESFPTYANMLSDSECKAVVDDHRKQIVRALTKLCQVDKESVEKTPSSRWSRVATFIPSLTVIPQTNQEKAKVLSAVLRELKDYLHNDDTSSVVIEDMMFHKSNVQLELQYKIERCPNSKRTRQLYSIEVPEGELTKLKQQQDHVPSLQVIRRPLALPLQATETLRYFAVLKSGKLVAVIESPRQEGCNVFLLPLADFTYNTLPKPVFSIKKSIDMLDCTEDARLMVVHIPSTGGIEFITITEELSRGSSNGSFHYGEKISDTKLTQLLFAPGGQKLHMLFDNHTCWTFDVKQRIMKGRHIEVIPVIKAALITPDGVHLLIATDDQADQCVADAPRSTSESTDVAQHSSQIYIYSLESRKFVTTLSLPSSSIPSYCLESLQLMPIGSQTYLVALDKSRRAIRLCLTTIKGAIASIKKSCVVPGDLPPVAKSLRQWNYLDYFHYIYEKFSIEDYFKFSRRRVDICCVVDDDAGDLLSSHLCDRYVDNLLEGLDISTSKPRRNFRLTSWYLTYSASLKTQLAQTGMSIAKWLQRIVCLLPVQVARADSNKLTILESGLERDGIIVGQEFPEVYNAIRFGPCEDIIKRWPGRVKVMSSMGKQSTGKSYLLNHAVGAMFDISGHRCTKGLWMTMRTMEDCLYVILDFEGLGSVQRTSQEDTLLSVTNAVISGLTVFKTEWTMYKETCDMLNQFKKGVELMKNHPKLLCGWFYVNVRDVKTADCQEVHQEFEENFDQIVEEDPSDNFLTKLYNSQRVVHTFPPIQDPTFYNNIERIVHYLKSDETPHLDTGAEFLDLFKQTLAKVHCGVWADFRDTIIQQKVFHIEQHLQSAVTRGSIIGENGEMEPLQTDSAVEIPDEPLLPNSASPVDDLPDTSIALGKDKSFETLIKPLLKEFEGRSGARSEADDAEDWTTRFQTFLTAICERREQRTIAWTKSYVGKYIDDRIDELWKDVKERLKQQDLVLCKQHCHTNGCQLPCLQTLRHDATSGHDCLGDHSCRRVCTFCSMGHASPYATLLETKPCAFPAGHRGDHDCTRHTCGKACDLDKRAKCKLFCAKKPKHNGGHDCFERHFCNEPCKAAQCQNKCSVHVPSSAPDQSHVLHNCGAKGCRHQCKMCASPCASTDHFHAPEGGHHFCGKEHDCPEVCNVLNSCRTEYVERRIRINRSIVASGSTTVNVEVTVRNRCGIKIPRNQTKHEKPNEHRCGENGVSTVTHICCVPCPTCQRLCKRPAGHPGRHKTDHGYMWRTVMASATADFNIGDTHIKRGQSGMDQLMCQVYCEKLGRGHTHLVTCESNARNSRACNAMQSEGRKHCDDDVKFSDDDNVPKDELTHDAYWKHINFEDPTSSDDRQAFRKCNYMCSWKLHSNPEWCKRSLWHNSGGSGTPRELDGHVFNCKHLPFHHILLMDKSISMGTITPTPEDPGLAVSHPNRLGVAIQCILKYLEVRCPRSNNDIYSIIPFNHRASSPITKEGQFDLPPLVKELKQITTSGATSFDEAFKAAFLTIKRFEHQDHRCVIVFLSDGEDETFNGDVLESYLLDRKDRRLPSVKLHTVSISDTDCDVFQKIVNIAKKAFPTCKFAAESCSKTSYNAGDLLEHYQDLAVRINQEGGFMSTDVLTRPGHRSR